MIIRSNCIRGLNTAHEVTSSLRAIRNGFWAFGPHRRWLSSPSGVSDSQAGGIAPSTSKKRSKRDFTKDEDRIIVNLRSERTSWPQIKLALPHRSESSLRQRWENHLRPEADFEHEQLIPDFTPSEEEKLSRLKNAGRSWFEIKNEYPDRYLHALRAHWNFKLKDSPFRGRDSLSREEWSISDQRELLRLRNELQQTWTEISIQFAGRPLTSIKTKYYSLHSPPSTAFARQPFTEVEDAKLLELKAQGLVWKEIAREFPTRSVKSLSNRFFIVRARLRTSSGDG